MRLILVRHGESVWNLERRIQGSGDSPLSPRGRAQAEQLAACMAARFRPAAVYSSALRRAADTTEAVARRHGLAVQTDARLNQYHIGVLTGLTGSEVRAQHPAVWQQWRQGVNWPPIPDEEWLDAFCARIAAAFSDISARHPAEA